MRIRFRDRDSGLGTRDSRRRLAWPAALALGMWALLMVALPFGVAAEEELRVVSLAPHLTELAFAAGAADTLVGVVAHSDWPAAARTLPRIGDAYRFDLEAIVGLNANLALAWRGGTPGAVANRLEQLGIEVLWVETRSLEDIASALVRIGTRLGAAPAARTAARRFRARLDGLRQRDRGAAATRIFYQVSARPLFTLGSRHVINEVFEICNAHNVFADLDAEAAAIDREAVITRAPDWILASRNGADDDPLAIWRDVPMVTEGRTRLAEVSPDRLVRPTPRIIDGIDYICALIADKEQPSG